jgi:hypothetical protein
MKIITHSRISKDNFVSIERTVNADLAQSKIVNQIIWLFLSGSVLGLGYVIKLFMEGLK